MANEGSRDSKVDYTVVVPIFNEAQSLKSLCASIRDALKSLPHVAEIILVDDGSDDATLETFKELVWDSGRLSLLAIGHKGQSVALQAGFDVSQGNIIITLDGDLQNEPQDIPLLLRKLDEGYDVVCGWRHERQDPLMKKIQSKLANWVRRRVTRDPTHDVGCTLRVFKKEVTRRVRLTSGFHRFFATLAVRQGFRVGEVKVRHYQRRFGVTKYQTWDRFSEGLHDLMRILRSRLPRIDAPPEYRIREIIRK